MAMHHPPASLQHPAASPLTLSDSLLCIISGGDVMRLQLHGCRTMHCTDTSMLLTRHGCQTQAHVKAIPTGQLCTYSLSLHCALCWTILWHRVAQLACLPASWLWTGREAGPGLGNAAHDEQQFEAVVRTARALLAEGGAEQAAQLARRSMAAFGRRDK